MANSMHLYEELARVELVYFIILICKNMDKSNLLTNFESYISLTSFIASTEGGGIDFEHVDGKRDISSSF